MALQILGAEKRDEGIESKLHVVYKTSRVIVLPPTSRFTVPITGRPEVVKTYLAFEHVYTMHVASGERGVAVSVEQLDCAVARHRAMSPKTTSATVRHGLDHTAWVH